VEISHPEEADLSGILAAASAAARADRESVILTENDLRARMADPRIDPERDLWVVRDPAAGVVAFAEGSLRQESRSALYATRGTVHPDFRGRGIGQQLLERQWARLAEFALEHSNLKLVMGSRVQDNQKGAVDLLTRFGLKPVRYLYEMEHNLVEPSGPGGIPHGLIVRLWKDRREDQAVWQAVGEAFRDHWGYIQEPFEAFEQRIATQKINPETSFIAWDGDQVAGGALNDMGAMARSRFLRNTGWLGMLFVRAPWRKQGLGQALLNCSFRMARELGHSHLRLTVDAENLTGAVRLYEKTGFHIAVTHILFHRPYQPDHL